MKLTKNEKRWLEWLRENENPHGFTLGMGKPTDRRTIQSLIDKHLIINTTSSFDVLVGLYAVSDGEDENGIALIVSPFDGTVISATNYGVPIKPLTDVEWETEHALPAHQNGNDTADSLYSRDDDRWEWMQLSSTRSSFDMLNDC